MSKRWRKLSPRDRRVAAVGAVVAVGVLAWSLLWVPLAASRAALREEAIANAAALAWMRPASTRLAALGGAPARTADTRSLLARVDASAREAGLGGSLGAIQPQGSQRVRAQFGGADFDVLAGWLQQRAAEGLRIEELSLQRASGAGRVDARVVLLDGGA